MNNKWQINKVGLIDFWYYDEEEFDFLDGRMLLRGANGSGKSVTMQSFIPLLLDGNMRPERLDPFGSRARKMENYLLEEGDEREERTGYLYMELKRLESEEYLTLGIGLRARKNKKLESWYFCITDGRRVGRDIFLYKTLENKITCSKGELKNRIGEGGRVMDTQGEYALCVNRLLFGFETQEEYKELLELLIQLRTPKLSKDFKPSVINEILSSSLQTLSEDDLRPMSEAIENMDNLKTNLDTLKESIRGAKQIEKVYDQYNRIVLYDKALMFSDASKKFENCEKDGALFKENLQANREKLREEKLQYEELKREEEVLKEEKISLDKSDAAQLKEQERRLMEELLEKQEEEKNKKRQETEKREREIDTEERIKKEEEKADSIWEEIEEYMEEMESEIEEIPFDEFSFMKGEILNEKEADYNFSSHNQILNDYTQKVEHGREALLEENTHREKYDGYLKELDICREEQNRAEKELSQYENLLEETKAEITEQIYIWEKENQELHFSTETMQNISRKIEAYEMGSDYLEIRNLGKNEFYETERSFSEKSFLMEQALKEKQTFLKEKQKELEEWENQKEPEPEQSDAVRKNRELLKEKGIPFLQFYKTIDFSSGFGDEQMNHLEEALLSMGVLDALIIPKEYRAQVYALDKGVCDRYIFSDVSHVRQNIQEILEVDNGENDILFYQNIANVLSSLGYGNDGEGRGNVWIDTEGNYKLGILEGTVTKEYQAHFIGVRARERFRREKTESLRQTCMQLKAEAEGVEAKYRETKERMEILRKEWEAFPGDKDLKVAAKELADREFLLELKNKRLWDQQELVEKERKILDEIRVRVREVCAGCYLPPRLDIFSKAVESLRRYKELLAEFQVAHGNYRSRVQYAKSQRLYLEEIEGDLNDIRYEMNTIMRRMRELEGLLTSVREQLALTDYEQIKERLDFCIERLLKLPQEREECVRRQESFEKEIEQLEEKIEENNKKQEELRLKKERASRVFEAEYKLGYVEKDFISEENIEEKAARICKFFAGRFGNKKQSDFFGSLQEAYHSNRGYLLDYQITMKSLFEEMEQEGTIFDISIKRIDISAKYRGIPVKFKELIDRMGEDEAALSRLLSDRDRELFEDILANTISKKIRGKIQASKRWVEKMNGLMESMQTSSGLKLSLRWRNKRAEKEEQLDTKALVELLQKDVEIMREEEVESLSRHFRSKIEEARKISGDTGSVQSFHATMREVLDYRKWFEFQLECQKTGEKKKELTDRVFFTFSGGEKAMAMYVPLFSAVVAKYAGARKDAPKLISLDEAFAGVDETNIRDMFRLMAEFDFNFMINSQILWGDYDTVPGLAIYQLIRPENAKFVSVIRYIWNGKSKIMMAGKE